MKKILLVANTDWYLYNFRRSLAIFLRAAGCKVILVSPTRSVCGRPAPIRVSLVGMAGRAQFCRPGRAAGHWTAGSIYHRERPDLVHHFTSKPVLYGSLAARLTGVPRVVNAVTGLGYVFLQNTLRARLLRQVVLLLYRLALGLKRQAVIFENNYDRLFFEHMRLVAPGKSRVIEGVGVDIEAYAPTPELQGIPLAVLPARMLWDKGIGVAAEAARQLKAQGCPLRLALVGPTDPGNPAHIPDDILQSWVAEGILEWWGFQEDMHAVYRQASLVTLPSFSEGVPTVLIEAAACGRAIVATDIPGCRNVVKEGETGLLIPPNDPTALADALCRLAVDPALRARMGAAGRARVVAHFSTEQVNREILAIYHALGMKIGGVDPPPTKQFK